MDSLLAKTIYILAWIQLILGVIGSFVLARAFGTPSSIYRGTTKLNGSVLLIALISTVVTALVYFAAAHILENTHQAKMDTRRLVLLAEKNNKLFSEKAQ